MNLYYVPSISLGTETSGINKIYKVIALKEVKNESINSINKIHWMIMMIALRNSVTE